MSLDARVALSHSSEPRLKRAILVYEDDTARKTLATLHDVHHPEEGDAQPQLGPARLLTMEGARDLNDALNRSSGVPFLPGNTLALAPWLLAWHEPAAVRRMWFHAHDAYLDSLSGQEFPQPPLVFLARGRGLNVYALGSDERPTPDTPLFLPPYFNTFANAAVCLGSTQLPDSLQPGDQAAYVEGFFKSAFTHVGNSNPVRGWEHSYGQFWQHVKELGRFPTEHLRPADTTLGSVLDGQ